MVSTIGGNQLAGSVWTDPCGQLPGHQEPLGLDLCQGGLHDQRQEYRGHVGHQGGQSMLLLRSGYLHNTNWHGPGIEFTTIDMIWHDLILFQQEIRKQFNIVNDFTPEEASNLLKLRLILRLSASEVSPIWFQMIPPWNRKHRSERRIVSSWDSKRLEIVLKISTQSNSFTAVCYTVS